MYRINCVCVCAQEKKPLKPHSILQYLYSRNVKQSIIIFVITLEHDFHYYTLEHKYSHRQIHTHSRNANLGHNKICLPNILFFHQYARDLKINESLALAEPHSHSGTYEYEYILLCAVNYCIHIKPYT